MATLNKFYCFVEDLAEQKHNLGSDALKLMLTSGTPSFTNTVKTDIPEVSGIYGYPSGGVQLSNITSAQTSGVYKLSADTVVITAATGVIGPFRNVVLYNNTHASKPLISWWDYGSSISLNPGESLTVNINSTSGVLTIQ